MAKNTKIQNTKGTAKTVKAPRTVTPVVMPKFQQPKAAPKAKAVKAPVVEAAVVAPVVNETPVTAVATPRQRDPRLPEQGTPIVRKYKGHEVVVVEQADGRFTLAEDGIFMVRDAKSLSAAVAAYLKGLNLTTSVNGFFWLNLTKGTAAPRARKAKDPVAALTAAVNKAGVRFDKAVKQAAEAETALETARKALADAVAAQQPAAE